jgi:hypothetical protein
VIEREDNNARMAALWIMHGTACVKLLKAHGRSLHAENFEAALREFVDIIADEVGRENLSAAMDWAATQVSVYGSDFEQQGSASIH